VLALCLVGCCLGAPLRADRFSALERATHDPSWRVRRQAAYVLSKQRDARTIPMFERLLTDDVEAVRRMAGIALARLRAAPEPAPVVPVPTLPEPRPGTVHISIGGVGAKSKQVSPEMTQRLRELLLREFAQTPGLMIDGKQVTGYLIDSSITALSRKTTRDWVEINCEISVIIGRLPSKAMVMMTSGGATVQEPKGSFRIDRASVLEADALEGAVKGAHENLIAFLRKQP
jgi:hypothetical protein